MKKCLSFLPVALALVAIFMFAGCSAKETPSETPIVQQESEVIPEEERKEASAASEAAESAAAVEVSPEAAQAPEERVSPEAERAADAGVSPEAADADDKETASEALHAAESEVEVPLPEILTGSVLHLVPEHVTAIIYCPSLADLNDRVNSLAMELMPTGDNPEVIAAILADTFGAGFEDLAELEEIGLDLNRDFVIFMTSMEVPSLSAVVHLTDPMAMKQVIDAESEGTAPVEYNGVTYWKAAGGGGSFALIGDTLVFSQSSAVCEAAIDTYNRTKPAVTSNADYAVFLNDVAAGRAQVALHFNFETIAPMLTERLKGESEAMADGMQADPAAMSMAPFIEMVFSGVLTAVDQAKSMNATLEVQGTDVKLSPSLRFKRGSSIQKMLKGMVPEPLTHLGELPGQAFMNGAFQGDPELITELSMLWIKFLSQRATPEHAEKLAAMAKQMADFYSGLGEEWTFSANFGDSIIPDYLIVYELTDAQKVSAYMEEGLIKQLRVSMEAMQGMMGAAAHQGAFDMYADAHQGESMIYNGVEIKSYVFPNFGSAFGEMPPEAAGLLPEEWRWYYAFTGDSLLMAIGSVELIKTTLDNRAGVSTMPAFSEEVSYERLVSTLGLDSNLFFAISPMTLIKTVLPIIANAADPNTAAGMQMLSGMFMNLPEHYSIGFSAKAGDDVVGATVFLTLADFKELIKLIAMMQGMGQVQ